MWQNLFTEIVNLWYNKVVGNLKIGVFFMKFKSKKKEKKQENAEKDKEIEVVFGDDSALNISEVGDCMNDLRPKDYEKPKKTIVIPKTKKS